MFETPALNVAKDTKTYLHKTWPHTCAAAKKCRRFTYVGLARWSQGTGINTKIPI